MAFNLSKSAQLRRHPKNARKHLPPKPRSPYTSTVPIDGCTHNFQHLADVILPAHMERMRQAMLRPVPMQSFVGEKSGPKTCARHLGLPGDFSGCYVFMENGEPIYVGISRKVLSRMIQHVRGDDHFSASLAYLIATKKNPHTMRRKAAMNDPAFRAHFDTARAFLRSLRVAFIDISCPVELYGFELYCSMELDTDQWNTFRTH
jgi:hypothetical protein